MRRRLNEVLDEDRMKEIIVDVFKYRLEKTPGRGLIRDWIEYARKKGWDRDEDTLYDKVYDAIDLMRGYYYDRELFTREKVYDLGDFTPEGYEVCVEAERYGLGEVDFGDVRLEPDSLEDAISMVKSGWKPFELSWVLAGGKPKGYVELYWSLWDDADYGDEVYEFLNEIADKYGVEYNDVREAFDEVMDGLGYEPFKKLGNVVAKYGEGFFDGVQLVYCTEQEWDKIKKKLERYIVERLKEYYEDLEEVGESRVRRFKFLKRR